MNTVTLLIGITLMYATPLIFGALGGVVSERSGVVNIGIEGMMTIGAFVGIVTSYYTNNVLLGVIFAGLAGGALALLHAVAAISFNADQTISGIALNLIGPGLALFFCRQAFDGAIQSPPVEARIAKLFSFDTSTAAGNLNNIDVMALVAILGAVALWFFIYKTKWGLRLQAVGENPAAADTLGINVKLVRYLAVFSSGVLAGIGGAVMTLSISGQFQQTSIAGQGYIALAAVIFGKWTPHGAYMACLVFGFAQALAIVFGGGNIPIPSEIMNMLPYIITIVFLVLFVGKSVAPKADGVPYKKGER